jgi:hypothetical protein
LRTRSLIFFQTPLPLLLRFFLILYLSFALTFLCPVL